MFLQIAKQLRDNPSPESMERGWVLMRLCCEQFPPSEDAENFVEHFLRSRGARSCVQALHLSLFRGAAAVPPSLAAVTAAFSSAPRVPGVASSELYGGMSTAGSVASPSPYARDYLSSATGATPSPVPFRHFTAPSPPPTVDRSGGGYGASGVGADVIRGAHLSRPDGTPPAGAYGGAGAVPPVPRMPPPARPL